MLREMNLPNKLWAEAANTTMFQQNRLPSSAMEFKTPFEAWYGNKPSLNFLKVFGCLNFTLVPHRRRDRLDEKVILRIFIWYSLNSNACEINQPKNDKIIISRDVYFIEDEEWIWDD